MKATFVLIGLFVTIQTGLAQKPVDLMLQRSTSMDKANCFDIKLRSPGGHDIDLAGQNYRLFYDAAKMDFLPKRITSSLDAETYSKIDLINTIDHNIGFVSISIDGRALTKDILKLDRDGSWRKTLNICFERSSDGPFDLTWANAKKTHAFATAEVAMSEWEDEENQQVLTPNEILDFSSIHTDVENISTTAEIRVYPNPVVDYINVDIEGESGATTLLIKDVIGREIINERVEEGTGQLQYSLDNLAEGTYTVLLLGGEGQYLATQNVVKVNP